ncbi:MAG TPA: hypothetical protein VF786_06860 [Terriglobales bacterium]
MSGNRVRACIVVFMFLVSSAFAQTAAPTLLDDGYRDMYNLQFAQAHHAFQQWQEAHPDDPVGPVSDAAAYLFAEFDRLHVLEFELFVVDSRFQKREKVSADPQVKQAFESNLAKCKRITDRILVRDPGNADALFSSALTEGLRGDYLSLIEKRDLTALGNMKTGRGIAEKLIAAHPDYYDAYLALGVENYLLSLKPAPIRWLLRVTGAQTDHAAGIEKLRITAEKGHFLQPYARLLLAVAALRDGNRPRADELLSGLARQFPNNHLYAMELAKLQH